MDAFPDHRMITDLGRFDAINKPLPAARATVAPWPVALLGLSCFVAGVMAACLAFGGQ